jgi:hypothetical protein
VLSVLLLFTDSDYSFGIKRFFHQYEKKVVTVIDEDSTNINKTIDEDSTNINKTIDEDSTNINKTNKHLSTQTIDHKIEAKLEIQSHAHLLY